MWRHCHLIATGFNCSSLLECRYEQGGWQAFVGEAWWCKVQTYSLKDERRDENCPWWLKYRPVFEPISPGVAICLFVGFWKFDGIIIIDSSLNPITAVVWATWVKWLYYFTHKLIKRVDASVIHLGIWVESICRHIGLRAWLPLLMLLLRYHSVLSPHYFSYCIFKFGAVCVWYTDHDCLELIHS
jgi:hypothetical protein